MDLKVDREPEERSNEVGEEIPPKEKDKASAVEKENLITISELRKCL